MNTSHSPTLAETLAPSLPIGAGLELESGSARAPLPAGARVHEAGPELSQAGTATVLAERAVRSALCRGAWTEETRETAEWVVATYAELHRVLGTLAHHASTTREGTPL